MGIVDDQGLCFVFICVNYIGYVNRNKRDDLTELLTDLILIRECLINVRGLHGWT